MFSPFDSASRSAPASEAVVEEYDEANSSKHADLEAIWKVRERRTGVKPKKEFMQYLQSMLEFSTDNEMTSRLEATDSEPEEEADEDEDESEEPEAPCRRRRRRRVRGTFNLASRPNHMKVMEVRLETTGDKHLRYYCRHL